MIGQDRLFKGVQPDVASGIRNHGNVQAGEIDPGFVHASGSWPKGSAVLMDATRKHLRIFVEDPLHSVSVMDIDIDVGDPFERFAEDRTGDRAIVKDAEAAGAVGKRVVEAAADAVSNWSAVGDGTGGGRRGAHIGARGLKHSGKRRVISPKTELGSEFSYRVVSTGKQRFIDLLDRVHIIGGVNGQKVGTGCEAGTRFVIGRKLVEKSEHAVEPFWFEGVAFAKSIVKYFVVKL
jgi:hypothetical protein